MNKEDKFKNLERIDSWINNADTKIAYLFTFLGIITTIIFTNDNVIEKIRGYINNILNLNKQDVNNIVSVINILLIAILMGFIMCCVYYLLKASNANISFNDINSNSTFFFGSIAKRKTLDEFKKAIKEQKDDELEDEILTQIYINSKICNEKLNNYNKSIKNLKIALIIMMVVMINMIIN